MITWSRLVGTLCGLLLAHGCVVSGQGSEPTQANAGREAAGATGGQEQGTGGSGGRGGTNAATGGSGGGSAGRGSGGSVSSGGSGPSNSAGEGGVENDGAAGADYPHVPAPVCTDTWVDFGCDETLPLDCAAPDQVISFDADRNAHCPVCAAPPTGALLCDRVRTEYRAFLGSIISSSCANYCEADDNCAAWEIVNACGSVAVSLRALIDEEPIGFAEEFASTRCASCGEIPQRISLRRAGSPNIEGDLPSSGLLDHYSPRCVNRQCVLQPL